MSRAGYRRQVIAAQHRYALERRAWRTRTRALQACIARDREKWIVGGGFASGFLTGVLPIRSIARAVNLLAGTFSFALRSPIGNMLREWSRGAGASASATPRSTRPIA
jgi:hypothetical protein